MENREVIDQLNSFLRGEISAVETYRQALETVSSLGARSELQQCARSHEERVAKLQSLIAQKGGEPATDSGPWGAFAKLVAGTAAAISEGAAVAALEEGEDHGLNDFKADMGTKLDPATRVVFEREIYAEQVKTHSILSQLKKQLAKGDKSSVQ